MLGQDHLRSIFKLDISPQLFQQELVNHHYKSHLRCVHFVINILMWTDVGRSEHTVEGIDVPGAIVDEERGCINACKSSN